MTALQNEMDTLTANNMHTEALILASKEIGGELGRSYEVILNEINDMHIIDGEISLENYNLRNAIGTVIRGTLRLQGKLQ